jgi:ADP-ribose pyrophosphatase
VTPGPRDPASDNDDLVWPRERSEPAGDFRHFRVRRDWNRSPRHGELRDFYVLDMPDWVQVLAVTPEATLVMVEQFRPGTRAVTTEFPAGLVEPGERPETAAARELEEETGYRGGDPVVIGEMHPNAALQNNRLFIVVIEECRPTGHRDQDPGEAIRPLEMDPSTIEEMMDTGRFRDAYGAVAWSCYQRHSRRAAKHRNGDRGDR